MRKLLFLVLASIIAIIGNFSFWFMHTRTISKTVDDVSRQLALKGVELRYKEIKFTNFLAWDVRAVVEDVSIKYGTAQYNSRQHFNTLHIRSRPLQKQLKISLPMHVHSLSNTQNKIQETLVEFDRTPFMKIKLSSSLAAFDTALSADASHWSRLIHEVLYLNGAFRVLDIKNNQTIYSGEHASFWVVNKSEKDEFSSGWKAELHNLSYNENYVNSLPEDLRAAYTEFAALGNINIKFDAMASECVEKSTEALGGKKSAAIRLSTTRLDIKELAVLAKPFGIVVQGNLEKMPGSALPIFDFKLHIRDYRGLIKFYSSLLNEGISSLARSEHRLPFEMKPITQEQINALSAILGGLSSDELKNQNDTLLRIARSKDGVATISGKPLALVLQQLHAIFIANLPSMRAPEMQEGAPTNIAP